MYRLVVIQLFAGLTVFATPIPQAATSVYNSQATPSIINSQAALPAYSSHTSSPSSSFSVVADESIAYSASSQGDVEKANDICSNVITVPGCDELMPDKKAEAIENCVSDILSSNSFLFVDGHKQAYNLMLITTENPCNSFTRKTQSLTK